MAHNALSEAAKALWARTEWRRNRLKAGAPHALLPTNHHHSALDPPSAIHSSFS